MLSKFEYCLPGWSLWSSPGLWWQPNSFPFSAAPCVHVWPWKELSAGQCWKNVFMGFWFHVDIHPHGKSGGSVLPTASPSTSLSFPPAYSSHWWGCVVCCVAAYTQRVPAGVPHHSETHHSGGHAWWVCNMYICFGDSPNLPPPKKKKKRKEKKEKSCMG